MKIVDLVKANSRLWIVFDEPVGQLTYEEHGGLLIGSDERGIFYDCLYYDRPSPNMRAFGGREFDLPMKDGTMTHCNGQYWYGRISDAEKVVGEEIAEIGASTKEELKQCYVFTNRNISAKKLEEMIEEFKAANPDYEPMEYRVYEELLKLEKSVRFTGAEIDHAMKRLNLSGNSGRVRAIEILCNFDRSDDIDDVIDAWENDQGY